MRNKLSSNCKHHLSCLVNEQKNMHDKLGRKPNLFHHHIYHLLQVKWNDVDEGYGRHYFEYNHDYKNKPASVPKVPIRRL